jgi:hypothetical protein
MYDTSPYGIWYDFLLVQSGAIFSVYKRKLDTEQDIEKTKLWLENNRDVVGKINIINVDDKGEIT